MVRRVPLMRPRLGDRARGSDGVTHVILTYFEDGDLFVLACSHGEDKMEPTRGPPTCLFCVARRAGPMTALMSGEALR